VAKLWHQLHRPLCISLISSWENAEKPACPTAGARRDGVRDERRNLLDELLCLRDGTEPAAARYAPADPWTFPQDQDITIVCAPPECCGRT
jgi:hypothetical protein